jgi:hypothetical protein
VVRRTRSAVGRIRHRGSIGPGARRRRRVTEAPATPPPPSWTAKRNAPPRGS